MCGHWSRAHYITGIRILRRGYVAASDEFGITKTRNIGIIAHIDAGKTTTTERMLFYSGVTKRIGNVDDGNTVMDYLSAERERGITINSASITFAWNRHQINLIDTPGHVDFTMEVERAVRVLDGAVTILDGSAGVEAQTETVWHQADRYSIPRIAFVNKMDRIGAAFGRTVQELWNKFNTRPLVLQIPIIDHASQDANGSGLEGIIDLVTMDMISWDPTVPDGSQFERKPLPNEWKAEAKRGRIALVESLADLDETIVDSFLGDADGDHLRVAPEVIQPAIRRATLANKAVPVLCGASYKNVGVQPLLDAVIDYLPSPLDRPPAIATLMNGQQASISPSEKAKLCALAFKVTHDPRRGPLVYCKIYAGQLLNRMSLYNTSARTKERVNKVLQMYAKEAEEIPSTSAGNIAVLVGLKGTRTGDTLVASNDSQAIKSGLQLDTIDTPQPAFFAAIEPDSIADEPAVQEALQHLIREDPSLKTWTDPESGQLLVSGMGELHLEIVKGRLQQDFRAKATMGPMRISYRETCQETATTMAQYDREFLGKSIRAGCRLTVAPDDDDHEGFTEMDSNWFTSDTKTITSGEPSGNIRIPISPDEIRQAVRTGILSGLSRGVVLGFPLAQVKVSIDELQFFGEATTTGAIASCVSNAVHEAAKMSRPSLLEPMMEVRTTVNEQDIGNVVGDLSGTRRGHVLGLESLNSDEDATVSDQVNVYIPRDSLLANDEARRWSRKQIITAHVPLSAMLGYASALRSLTGGSGQFSMRVIGYGPMSQDRERTVIKELRGW